MHEWLNGLWAHLILQYYLAIERNKFIPVYTNLHAHLEVWWVKKPSPSANHTYCLIPFIQCLQNDIIAGMENRLSGCQKVKEEVGMGGSWYDYKQAICGILVVIEMFYILCQYACLHCDSVLQFLRWETAWTLSILLTIAWDPWLSPK